MGIHDLLPFLQKYAKEGIKPYDEWCKSQNKLILAIDTPIFMHKYAYSVGTGKSLCVRMLKFANDLIEKNIEPIFVFDGKKLEDKEIECNKRILALHSANNRFKMRKVEINNEEYEVERTCIGTKPLYEDYEALKESLKLLNIEICVAQYEAEALCSYLVKSGRASAVLTEDTDAIAYLSDAVILKWNSDNEIVVLIDEICSSLDLQQNQFQELCVLFGNDFNDRLKGIGPVKALALIKKFNSLENYLLKETSINELQQSKMRKSMKIFSCFCYENIITSNLIE